MKLHLTTSICIKTHVLRVVLWAVKLALETEPFLYDCPYLTTLLGVLNTYRVIQHVLESESELLSRLVWPDLRARRPYWRHASFGIDGYFLSLISLNVAWRDFHGSRAQSFYFCISEWRFLFRRFIRHMSQKIWQILYKNIFRFFVGHVEFALSSSVITSVYLLDDSWSSWLRESQISDVPLKLFSTDLLIILAESSVDI